MKGFEVGGGGMAEEWVSILISLKGFTKDKESSLFCVVPKAKNQSDKLLLDIRKKVLIKGTDLFNMQC